MLRNGPHCAACRNRSIAAKRTGHGRSPACAGAGSADAGRAARRGYRGDPRGARQHGAQLAGLLCAWRSGGAAAAHGAGTAGHDRPACRGDRRVDPERRHAPRWRLDVDAPSRRDCPARRAGDLAAVACAPTAPKGFAWRRPRHTLKGRQESAAVEASRERLAELKTKAAAGAIDLVFLDESEVLTHPYLARCWARRGAELRIQAPGQAKKQAMLGAFDPVNRRLLVHTSATKRSTDFIDLLDQLGAAYGTAERARPLVAVLDNGPIHHSKLTTRAIAQRTWLTVEWLPKYAPELNDPGSRPGQAIERCWRDLKQHQLANRTPAFTGAGSSPMRTLSNAPFLTPSPALTTSDNLIHRLFPYSLLSSRRPPTDPCNKVERCCQPGLALTLSFDFAYAGTINDIVSTNNRAAIRRLACPSP